MHVDLTRGLLVLEALGLDLWVMVLIRLFLCCILVRVT